MQMEQGSNVKQMRDPHKDTELHLATKNGDLDTVNYLLNACDDPGGLISQVNARGETPLYVAAFCGHLEILRELLRFAHPDTLTTKNNVGYDAFHIAAKKGHLGIVKEFLKHKSSLCMTRDLSNGTPLISAAYEGHVGVVRELLSADRQLIDTSRSNGKNALHLAARDGNVDIVKALLDKDPLMARKTDKKGQTALHMAAKGATSREIVQVILSVDPAITMFSDRNSNTALHVATRKKRVEIVKRLLLSRYINVNALNRLHKTALDLAEELQSSEEASVIEDALRNAGALMAKTMISINDDVHNQPKHARRRTYEQAKGTYEQMKGTYEQVKGIADELRKMHNEGSINNATNSVTVVAVLFATVAFAAIFTVPGGFVGDNNNGPAPPGEDNGTAVVAHLVAFKVFFIFNSISLFTSIAVVLVQLTLVPRQTRAQEQLIFVINKLMWLASVSTSVAFLASAFIVVGRKSQWIAITVSVIGAVIIMGVLGILTFFVVKSRSRRSITSRHSTSLDLEKIYGI